MIIFTDPHYHSVADVTDIKMYDAEAGEKAHLKTGEYLIVIQHTQHKMSFTGVQGFSLFFPLQFYVNVYK